MKIDVNALRAKLENDGRGATRQDPTVLRYFDLDFGERMRIRLLPATDDNDLYLTYATHRSNQRGKPAIRCVYESKGESCPACVYGYSLFEKGDEEGSKKWRKRETFVAQCVVIKSDIEIPDTDDGNPVRKIYLPFRVKEMIRNSILNGVIEDPTEHDLIIAKTRGAGDRASYESSMFDGRPREFPEEILDQFEKGTAYLYDLTEDMPEAVDSQDVQDWLDDLLGNGNGSDDGATKSRTSVTERDIDEEDEEQESSTASNSDAEERAARLRAALKRSRS